MPHLHGKRGGAEACSWSGQGPVGLERVSAVFGPSKGEPTPATLSLPTSSPGLLLDASDVDPVLACTL